MITMGTVRWDLPNDSVVSRKGALPGNDALIKVVQIA